MNLTGLITEYNPFHNGHHHHLICSKKTTNANAIVVVMSGNFVQRGTPALLDKWTRTEMALKGGADLVLELPTVFATGSAEIFALGAIRVLNGLSKINHVVFGSESGDLAPLHKVAHYLHDEPKDFQDALKSELSSGHSFPVARERALNLLLCGNGIPTLPNDILGIEYIKAGLRINTSMKFSTIQRLSSDYHDLDTDKALSSATAIRNSFFEGKLSEISHTLPETSYDMLKAFSDQTVHPDKLSDIMLYKIRTTDVHTLEKIQDVSEGLEYRIKDSALKAKSYLELVDLIKTKRYVRTRIQRTLLNILLNVENELVSSVYNNENAAYARVLGFNDTGRKAMNHLRKDSNIPLITNVNKFVPEHSIIDEMLHLDMRATDVYTLLRGDNTGALDRLKQPIYLKE